MGMTVQQSSISQPPHMSGHRGLDQAQVGNQVHDTMLAKKQVLHDLQTTGISQGFEQGRPAFEWSDCRSVYHRHIPMISVMNDLVLCWDSGTSDVLSSRWSSPSRRAAPDRTCSGSSHRDAHTACPAEHPFPHAELVTARAEFVKVDEATGSQAAGW